MAKLPCRIVMSIKFVNACSMRGMYLTEGALCLRCHDRLQSMHLWLFGGTGEGAVQSTHVEASSSCYSLAPGWGSYWS